jgi:hypothetical protein
VLALACGCMASPSPTSGVPVSPPIGPASTTDASRPPAAFLAVNGQGRHPGELGTYIYRGAGSDSPWLPARSLQPVAVPAGGRLAVRLADQRLIGAWSVKVAPAADDQGVTARVLSAQPDVNRRWAVVDALAPPPGPWVLVVTVDYGDGSGSGSYFWLVEVS